MTTVLCQAWHRRSSRTHPRASWLVRHRDDPPEKARKLCGTHARSFKLSAARGFGNIYGQPIWIIESIP